jgi:hypothetical protein
MENSGPKPQNITASKNVHLMAVNLFLRVSAHATLSEGGTGVLAASHSPRFQAASIAPVTTASGTQMLMPSWFAVPAMIACLMALTLLVLVFVGAW